MVLCGACLEAIGAAMVNILSRSNLRKTHSISMDSSRRPARAARVGAAVMVEAQALARAALDEMHEAGFRPEFGPGVAEQLAEIEARFTGEDAAESDVEDLRGLGWSSIDNDTSRDLDQIEAAERVPDGIRLRVAIGDVAAAVAKGTRIMRMSVSPACVRSPPAARRRAPAGRGRWRCRPGPLGEG